MERVYEMLTELIEGIKGEENVVIMGDWNATVGEGREGIIVGPFGLSKRNDRVGRLVEFCSRYHLMITNTWYQHHPRRRYTWRAPDRQ